MKRIWEWIKKAWAWLRTDGQLHLLASLSILLLAYLFFPGWVANCLAIAVAFGKEIYDLETQTGDGEWHDLLCDGIGILIGNVAIWLSLLLGL